MRKLAASLLLFIVVASHPVVVEARTVVHGVASWYRYVPGGAAAGPALRRALGPKWRGQWVRVCTEARCVRVHLTDWCQCSKGKPGEKVIDLDVRSFAALALPSRGIVRVVVVVP